LRVERHICWTDVLDVERESNTERERERERRGRGGER